MSDDISKTHHLRQVGLQTLYLVMWLWKYSLEMESSIWSSYLVASLWCPIQCI